MLTSQWKMCTPSTNMHASPLSKNWIIQWLMELNFHLLTDGDGNQGIGGIDHYPAAMDLEDRVKRYATDSNRELEKKQLDG